MNFIDKKKRRREKKGMKEQRTYKYKQLKAEREIFLLFVLRFF